MRKTVYLSLGSNMGDRAAHLVGAIEAMRELGEVSAVSSTYETEPVDFSFQGWFLNCAVALETEMMPKQLLAALQRIETQMGRRRTVAKGPRTIDIDVLLFANAIVDTADLTVPHPAMHERRFVLEPLAEIAPEVRHPVLKKSAREMRDALPPGQAVRKVSSSR